MSTVTVKQGDTFSVVCTYTDDAGTAINLTTTSTTVASQVRKSSGELVADLTVAILDQTVTANVGKYTLTADTAAWPVASLVWDIQYVQAGVISSTDTITLVVISGVTA